MASIDQAMTLARGTGASDALVDLVSGTARAADELGANEVVRQAADHLHVASTMLGTPTTIERGSAHLRTARFAIDLLLP